MFHQLIILSLVNSFLRQAATTKCW